MHNVACCFNIFVAGMSFVRFLEYMMKHKNYESAALFFCLMVLNLYFGLREQ